MVAHPNNGMILLTQHAIPVAFRHDCQCLGSLGREGFFDAVIGQEQKESVEVLESEIVVAHEERSTELEREGGTAGMEVGGRYGYTQMQI